MERNRSPGSGNVRIGAVRYLQYRAHTSGMALRSAVGPPMSRQRRSSRHWPPKPSTSLRGPYSGSRAEAQASVPQAVILSGDHRSDRGSQRRSNTVDVPGVFLIPGGIEEPLRGSALPCPGRYAAITADTRSGAQGRMTSLPLTCPAPVRRSASGTAARGRTSSIRGASLFSCVICTTRRVRSGPAGTISIPMRFPARR